MIKDEILESFLMINVLITGGTGLIGREISMLLVNVGAHVRVVTLDQIKIHKKVDHVYGDLTNSVD